LRSILTEPKKCVNQAVSKLFLMDEVEFTITDEALDFVVDKSIRYKLGARGLRSLCEAILTDAMYELPSSDDKTLVIDSEYARETLNKNLLKRLEIAS
jgi:ATP-dependent Clp protease ATP-binding subunit ClpX